MRILLAIIMSFTASLCHAGHAQLFDLDEATVRAELAGLSALERYISETGLTYHEAKETSGFSELEGLHPIDLLIAQASPAGIMVIAGFVLVTIGLTGFIIEVSRGATEIVGAPYYTVAVVLGIGFIMRGILLHYRYGPQAEKAS